MSVPRAVTTRPRRDLLPTLREMLARADDAVLATAFIDTRGIHLVGEELQTLGERCRLVATSTFRGDRAHAAFAAATQLGTRCRVLNPSGGTFHPKVVVARHGDSTQALVGSANLTAGLLANVEAGIVVNGAAAEDIRELVEAWWTDAAAADWQPPHTPVVDVLEAGLWALIQDTLHPGVVIHTIADNRPNTVVEVSRAGIWVETDRSRRARTGPQLVEPRMIEVAWAAMLADGELTNRRLLRELRVHRSSFVCALLARLPGVHVASRRPIRLILDFVPDAGHLLSDEVAAEARGPFDADADD